MDSTKVKICGIRDVKTALFCSENGADFIGLNFSPVSIRKIELANAENIYKEFIKLKIKSTAIVFLFYKNPINEIKEIINKIKPDYIQYITDDISGAEMAFTKIPLIPAIRVKSKITDQDLLNFNSELFILDSWSENLGGGSGKTFYWQNIQGITKKFLLAGGLTVNNVQNAVKTVRPFGVDIASGVESAPGIKDKQLIKQFILNAKRS